MTANGQLAPSQLVPVEGQYLSPATAAAYNALKAAAIANNRSVSIWTPVGAYRSLATQQDMHDRPWLYNLNPDVALAPSGQSRHGQGRAVDIKTTGASRLWIQANAASFGFTRPFAQSDPDHYEHGSSVVTTTDPTPAPTPTPLPTGDEMKYIYKEEGGVAWAIIDSHLEAGYLQTTVLAEAEKYARVCPTPAVLVSAATFTASLAAASWYKTQCPAPSATSSGLTTEEHNALVGLPAAVEDIPTNAEMGTALTNTVNFVNEHTDAKFDGLTLSTP